ncbi:MAG TPA: transposase [Streptosporangiaceae bacterium]|nr:transposase [Streptosporangiaceae bacterium]
MSRALRAIAGPFVAAGPTGVRVRTRLRLSPGDAAVLQAAGTHLGSLAGRDLAARCREGRLDAKGRAVSRAARKRALTSLSSSRWAGAITRTSEDAWQLADRNLRAERAALRAQVSKIGSRLAIPVGRKAGRMRGYATVAERYSKQVRLQALKARLARVEQRIDTGAVSIVRGGRVLLRNRANLATAGLTEAGWRERWEAGRLFLTADGEAGKTLGNETIRWSPDEQWLELKLPAPLAHLANRPHGRYRLSCPVEFPYRGDEVAAQATSGAVRYDISHDPRSGRWYLDASWRASPGPVPSLDALRQHPVVAVDVNAGHLAVAVITPDGNPAGVPFTIPLDLAGLPATARDGWLRAAISTLIATAKARGARAVVIEDLDFAAARAEGRERTGNRPSRGRCGKAFRRAAYGIPTGKFRDRLTQMTANAGLAVVAVDPAYTSRWGAEHWLAPLQQDHPEISGHHAAAVVIGRRALGHRAQRREGVTRPRPEDRGVRTAPRAPGGQAAKRNGGPRTAQRQPPRWRNTATAGRGTQPDQVAQDRSGPPDSRNYLLQSH